MQQQRALQAKQAAVVQRKTQVRRAAKLGLSRPGGHSV